MLDYEKIPDLLLDNIKKLFYPQEWISLDLEFSKSELFTMLLVERQGEIIMSKIADYINVPMSTPNGIVERLVKNGYLDRERSDEDRRIVVIRLTDKGRELVKTLKSTVMDYIKLIFEALDDEERKLIFKIVDKVMDLLAKKGPAAQTDGEKKQLKKITIE